MGDYGTAVNQYPGDYYQGVPAIPVRWCAPETIHYTNTTLQPKQTTKEANIWSLGVTMWEISEWGRQPYDWLSDDEVISQVLGPQNIRLPKPDKISTFYIEHLYRLMHLCWTPIEQRPNVQHIHDMLAHLLQVANSSSSLKTREFSIEDFDSRWDNFKPNTIVKTDNHIETEMIPTEKITDISSVSSIADSYINDTKKSPSLTNLHGSFDNLLPEGESCTPNTELDSWLQNVASDTGDMSYVQGLSQAIHALDSALASEQTSSSSSSYRPSPGPEQWDSNRKIEFKLGPADRISAFSTSNEPNSPMDSILYPRNESGSETEDETWKKRIERGAYSEKVRQKSKSVADLMILTHIECSDTDSETPLQSLEFKNSPAYKNVRCASRGGMESSMIYGSEGNLLEVQDTFQEELRKLQEERRDSLLFVPARSQSIVQCIEKTESDTVSELSDMVTKNLQNLESGFKVEGTESAMPKKSYGDVHSDGLTDQKVVHIEQKITDTANKVDTFAEKVQESVNIVEEYSSKNVNLPLENKELQIHISPEITSVITKEEQDTSNVIQNSSVTDDLLLKGEDDSTEINTPCKETNKNESQLIPNVDYLIDDIESKNDSSGTAIITSQVIEKEDVTLQQSQESEQVIKESVSDVFQKDLIKNTSDFLERERKISSPVTICDNILVSRNTDLDVVSESQKDTSNLENITTEICDQPEETLPEKVRTFDVQYIEKDNTFVVNKIDLPNIVTPGIENVDKDALIDNQVDLKDVNLTIKELPPTLNEICADNISLMQGDNISQFLITPEETLKDKISFVIESKSNDSSSTSELNPNISKQEKMSPTNSNTTNVTYIEEKIVQAIDAVLPNEESKRTEIDSCLIDSQPSVTLLCSEESAHQKTDAVVSKEEKSVEFKSGIDSGVKELIFLSSSDNLISNQEDVQLGKELNVNVLTEDSSSESKIESAEIISQVAPANILLKAEEDKSLDIEENFQRSLNLSENIVAEKNNPEIISIDTSLADTQPASNVLLDLEENVHFKSDSTDSNVIQTPEKSCNVKINPEVESIQIDKSIIMTVNDFLNNEKNYSNKMLEKRDKKELNLTTVTSAHSLIDYNALTDSTSVKPQVYNVFNVTVDHQTPNFITFTESNTNTYDKTPSVCTSSIQKEALPDLLQNKPLLNGFKTSNDLIVSEYEKNKIPPKLSEIILEKLNDRNGENVGGSNMETVFTSTPFIKRVKSVKKPDIFSYVPENNDSVQTSVIIGPCEDYTLELYSGLKTTFGKYSDDDRPEEEVLQFSSNFMPFEKEFPLEGNIDSDNTQVDYSLETWDKFLGKTLEDNEKTYDTSSPRLESLKLDESFYMDSNNVTDEVNEDNKQNSNEKTFVIDKTCIVKASDSEKTDPSEKVLNETYTAPQSDVQNQEKSADATFSVETPSEKAPESGDSSSWEPGEGWFLHPQTPPEDLTGQMDIQTDNSYVGFAIDEECVNALRTELAAKLPHAQGIANEEPEPDDWDSEARDEVIVKYNVYATPLSPIPEESCCDDMFCDQTQHNDGSDSDSDWSEPNRTSHLEDILIVDTETHTALILESPSPREPINRHTPSQDSCCSNDTLFNLEDLNYGPIENEPESRQNVLQVAPPEDADVNSENNDETTTTKDDTTNTNQETTDKSTLKLNLQPADPHTAHLPSPEDIPWRQLPASMLSYSQVALGDTFDGHESENSVNEDHDEQEIDFEQELQELDENEAKEEGLSEDEGDLYNNLTDIRFSGPCDNQLMSTSFSESAEIADDREWDSGSDTRSSSSGEFIWKVSLLWMVK